MKILLIQSYLGRKEPPVFPLGLAYLASYLGEHEVHIVDPNTEDDPFDSIILKLGKFNPDVIGISLRNIDTTVYKDIFNYYKTLEPTLDTIKKIVPTAIIIVGGPAFSLFAEEIMNRHHRIDFGIHLEGEETLPELLKNLAKPNFVKGVYYRQDGRVLFSGLRELSQLNDMLIPSWNLLNLIKYKKHPSGMGFQSKRGCSLLCAYCTYPFLTGHRLRLRPPQKVVDEIEELIKKNQLSHFMFTDPVFNLPRWHAVQICEEIINRGIKAKWSAYFSLRDMDEDFIRLAYLSGCQHFFFSPDGYSNESLNKLQKEVDKKQILNVYNVVKKLKLKGTKFDFGFFINAPGHNYASLFALLWLLFKTNFILPRKAFMHIGVNVPRLEPHTRLYNLAVKENTIDQVVPLLPLVERDLPLLFYKNPQTKLAQVIFLALLKIKNIILPRINGHDEMSKI